MLVPRPEIGLGGWPMSEPVIFQKIPHRPKSGNRERIGGARADARKASRSVTARHQGTGLGPVKTEIAEAKTVAWCACKHEAKHALLRWFARGASLARATGDLRPFQKAAGNCNAECRSQPACLPARSVCQAIHSATGQITAATKYEKRMGKYRAQTQRNH